MYTLGDIEWYEQNSVQIPTQLALLRIDDEFNTIGPYYYSRIKLSRDVVHVDWSHIAFSGGIENEFRKATSLDVALGFLKHWFHDDDVLLFWHESGATLFKKLCECNDILPPKIGVIRHIIHEQFSSYGSKCYNSYSLSKALSIPVPLIEHYALNDVQVLHKLLSANCIHPSSLIESGCCEWKPYIEKPLPRATIIKPQKVNHGFKYYHDRTTGLFHVAGCNKKTSDKKQLQGFQTLKGCIRRNLIPCKCCSKEADRYMLSTGHTEPCISGSVNSKKKLVHFAGCRILARIKPANIKSFMTIDESKAHGYTICPACNPILVRYIKEKTDIQKLCHGNGLTFTIKEDTAYITSKHDFWRIMIDNTAGNLTLYHRSTAMRRKIADNASLPMFHKQNNKSKSLVGHLKYIVDHDLYQDRIYALKEMPAKKQPSDRRPQPHSKKGRKLTKKLKRQKKRKAISRVMALFEELEAANGTLSH